MRDRDENVLERLADAINFRELSLMAEGEGIPLAALEERAPHVAVVLAFETAKAVASLW